MTEPGYRLLALDGGCLRDLTTLWILKRLMNTINPHDPPRPCHYFDVIGGHGAAGLIAIMLGQLEMDIDECIAQVTRLSLEALSALAKDSKIQSSQFHDTCAHFDVLGVAGQLLSSPSKGEVPVLPDLDSQTFVCKTRRSASSSDTPSISDYKTSEVWQHVESTFAPSLIADAKALLHEQPINIPIQSSPIALIYDKALQSIDDRRFKYVVSVGSGLPLPSGPAPRDSLMSSAQDHLACAEDEVWQLVQNQRKIKCFRLNMSSSPEAPVAGMAESQDLIVAPHELDLNFEQSLQTCATVLRGWQFDDKPKSSAPTEACTSLAKRSEWQVKARKGTKIDPKFNLFDKLSSYSPDRTLRRLAFDKCKNTTDWIVRDPEFARWFHGGRSACLWLTGIIGSGKTKDATTVVDHLSKCLRGSGRPVIHFFYDSNDQTLLTPLDLLESFVKQLINSGCTVNASINAAIKQFYGPQSSRADLHEISEEVLLPLIRTSRSPVFVVDGLDECSLKDRPELMRIFQRMMDSGARIFIASREDVNVAQAIPSATRIQISKSNARVKQDLERYIDMYLDRKLKEHTITDNRSTLQTIRQTLLDKADAMFLWVRLLLDGLWEDCLNDGEPNNDRKILKHVERLPQKLEDTYERCIARAQLSNGSDWLTILRWTCAALVPMHIEQLKEALNMDRATGNPKDEASKLTTSYVLKCGANLLTITPESYIVPAHHSVRQFVFRHLSLPSLGGTDTIERCKAELEIGELCVLYLLSRLSTDLVSAGPQRRTAAMRMPLHEVPLVGNILSARLKKSTSLVLPLPRKDTQAPGQVFFEYAQKAWHLHSKYYSKTTPSWTHFRHLVREPRSRLRYPWPSLGSGEIQHLSAMLGWAVVNEHTAMLKVIISIDSKHIKGPNSIFNLPMTNHNNMLPLHESARRGSLDVFNILETVADVHKMDADQNTTLLYAFAGGNIEIIDTALEWVPAKVRNSSVPLALMTKNRQLHNVLHIAVLHNQVQAALHFCARMFASSPEYLGVCLTARSDKEGNSPLQLALLNDNREMLTGMASYVNFADPKYTVVFHELIRSALALQRWNTTVDLVCECPSLVRRHPGLETLFEHLDETAIARLLGCFSQLEPFVIAGFCDEVCSNRRRRLGRAMYAALNPDEETYFQASHQSTFTSVLKLSVAFRTDEATAKLLDQGSRYTKPPLWATDTSLLLDAIRHSRYSTVQAFVDAGASALGEMANHAVPLHFALRQGDVKMTEILLGGPERRYVGLDETIPNSYLVAAQTKNPELFMCLMNTKESMWWGSSYKAAPTTPLTIALEAGFYDLVNESLESFLANTTPDDLEDIRKHAVREQLAIPLHLAVSAGSARTVDALLRLGADARGAAKDETPLLDAVTHGDIKIAELLLRAGADANAKTGENTDPARPRNALCSAVNTESEAMVQLLLLFGAKFNVADAQNVNPLNYALGSGQGGVTMMLVRSLPSLEGASWWMLRTAVVQNLPDVVELMIDRGIPLETKDKSEQLTLVGVAARYGHTKVLQVLLDKGLSPDTLIPPTARQGKTGSPSRPNLGTEPKDQMVTCYTPLQRAIVHGHEEAARLLFDRKALLGQPSEAKDPSLVFAALHGFSDLVKELIWRGIDIDLEFNGMSALAYAAAWGRTETVRIILSMGQGMVRAETRPTHLKTALLYASALGHEEIALMILDAQLRDGYFGQSYDALEAAAKYGEIQTTRALLRYCQEEASWRTLGPDGFGNVLRAVMNHAYARYDDVLLAMLVKDIPRERLRLAVEGVNGPLYKVTGDITLSVAELRIWANDPDEHPNFQRHKMFLLKVENLVESEVAKLRLAGKARSRVDPDFRRLGLDPDPLKLSSKSFMPAFYDPLPEPQGGSRDRVRKWTEQVKDR